MRGFSGLLTGILFAASLQASVYDQALVRYNHTDYSGAASLLKQASGDSRSLELLGRCYLMDADYRNAVSVLERAATLNPNNSMTQTWLARAYGRRAETSFAISAMNYAAKARQTFEKAVQLDPRNSEAVNDLFEFYVQAPGIVGGGLDKANGLLPLIGQNDPAEVSFARARIAEAKKEFPAAEVQLRKALQLAPRSLGRILDLARFLAQEGRIEESERLFQQAEVVAPLSPKVLFVRAESYIQGKRNLEQARGLLTQYLAAKDLTPDDPPRAEAVKLLKRSEGM